MSSDTPTAAVTLAKALSREVLKNSVEVIDAQFENGYAKKNPGLITGVYAAQTEIIKVVIARVE